MIRQLMGTGYANTGGRPHPSRPAYVCAFCVLAIASVVTAAEEPPAATRVLDTRSYWRVHATLRPPVFGTASDAKPDPESIWAEYRMNPETGERKRVPVMPPDQPCLPWPPSGWMKPEFGDSGWWRDPGPFFGKPWIKRGIHGMVSCHDYPWGAAQPRELALFCARGKFTVTDPSKIKGLKLNVTFRGGLVAYLNGQEVHRAHMAAGGSGFEALAEDYPAAAHTSKGGDLRMRQVGNVALPVSGLRKGTNVLALEIHRAAIPADKMKQRHQEMWSTVGLLEVRLESEGEGVESNISRPSGLQIWNANPLESVFDTDYGEPHEQLRPIRIVGVRGGVFSGQVVVGSDKPVKGLTAKAGVFANKGGAALAASAAAVFYPRPTTTAFTKKAVALDSESRRFDAFAETPPDEVRVKKSKKPVPGLGAVQPVWISVSVPRDAAAGVYEGRLTIGIEGRTIAEVPVQLRVLEYRLPEAKDFRTWVDFIQSPESLAIRYKVPMWSERHFELIGRTFRLLAGVGNKTLYIPLICRTNLGNSESMVRWVEKVGGGYDHDFSAVEKYLDCALKQGLRPQVVCLQVWDYHVGTDGANRGFGSGFGFRIGGMGGKAGDADVPVSLLDRASGEVKEMAGPKYSDPEAEAFWKPVMEGLRKRMKERGLEDAMMLGIVSDSVPGTNVVEFWKSILPETPWVCMAHAGTNSIHGAPIKYRTMVHLFTGAVDPEIERLHGWARPETLALFPRTATMGSDAGACMPLTFFRMIFEWNIQGKQRGVGRLAADFVPTKEGWGGRRISGRYPETSWGNLNLMPAWLAAGKDGPISTVAFEMAREGIQECEAYILVDSVLADNTLRAKLGEPLAKKCRGILDERVRHNLWSTDMSWTTRWNRDRFLPGGAIGFDWYVGGSRWQDRSKALYEAAAEVQAKLE